jgi:hypothetical protein
MQDYDTHSGMPDVEGANAKETTVKTIRLTQMRISDQKTRTYIAIVTSILCLVAGLAIILVVHERSISNINTQTEIPDSDFTHQQELTLTTDDGIPMSAQMNSDRAFDLEATVMPTDTSTSWVPTNHPSEEPSSFPSTTPSSWPSISPSTALPTPAPFLPIAFGKDFHWTNENLGIQLSVGLSAKIIAMSSRRVMYGNGNESSQRFHGSMDAAGIVSLQSGGYVYISNSEAEGSDGGTYFMLSNVIMIGNCVTFINFTILPFEGVFGLYFNDDGRVVDYKPLLTGTTRCVYYFTAVIISPVGSVC